MYRDRIKVRKSLGWENILLIIYFCYNFSYIISYDFVICLGCYIIIKYWNFSEVLQLYLLIKISSVIKKIRIQLYLIAWILLKFDI